MSDKDTRDIDNQQFLATIFSGATVENDEAVGVCAFQNPPELVRWWNLYSPSDPNIKRLIDRGDANTYFCISTVRQQRRLRRGQDDLQALYVVPLDDIGTGQGAKYAPDTVPLEPSYIVETSPQNYQYGYLPSEPIRDKAVARALVKLVTEETGDGAASIMGKLIRLPNGYNNKAKYGNPVPRCALKEWHPERRYSVHELLRGFGISEEVFETQVEKYRGQTRSTAAGAPFSDEVFDYLSWRGDVISDAADDDGWYQIVCPWHGDHSEQTDISKTASYSPLGCGGEHAKDRQFNCFHEHCKDRKSGHVVDWMFQERFVYNKRDNVIHDRIAPKARYAIDHFHNVMRPLNYKGGNGRMVYNSRIWIDRPGRINVDGETFMPNSPRVYRDLMTGERLFNSFIDIEHPFTRKTELVEPILEQLKYLFGPETENALSFLAYSIHKGNVRLPFALLHISPHHGTGRGWLKTLCDKLLLHGYHNPASFHNFATTSYNEFMYRTLLVSFDEVYNPKERYTIGERLRETITENEVEVNVKYGYKGTIPALANMMFFSNHENAIKIPDHDRRFWCVVCENKPRTAAEYSELYGLLDDGEGGPGEAVQQFYWYLKDYAEGIKNPEFNPKGRAPQTIWLEELKRVNDDEDLDGPISEVVRTLRMLGVNTIWRSHFVQLCRDAGADLPAFVNGRDKQWARFRAVLHDQNVFRSSYRLRSSDLLIETLGGLDKQQDYMLFIDRRDRQLAGRTLRDAADATIRLLDRKEEPATPPSGEPLFPVH